MVMSPDEILESIYETVLQDVAHTVINDTTLAERISLVSRAISNRAGVRLLMTCALAKIHQPEIDIRKPYTEIDGDDTFSGRTYDERYITGFVVRHELPCNPTTAFLTPALRNRNTVLTPDLNLSGRPKAVYDALLQLLSDVYTERISAGDLLYETIRQLVLLRDERQARMASLLADLRISRGEVPLSAEQIITLIEQHLATRGASRLPVLIVAAAYQVAGQSLGETALPLESHNAADSQTQALGDVQITLGDDEGIVTCYEMKLKRITREDIDHAIQHKLASTQHPIDNYIFITTEPILVEVNDYAKTFYEQIGVEVVVLDCVGFLRHFLHLFHRQRIAFLDAYQALVLAETESAVSSPLKEVFLALRQAAESD